tara:strand:- start:2402 stop:3523 length:1122 start_codon:yes stop_codon:yes gene_type:complete
MKTVRKMKTLLTVIGARPQWIKASAMSRVLQRAEHGIQEHVVHTGQHVSQEMSGIFFEELGMSAPNTLLEVEFDPARRMGQMMHGIAATIAEIKPDAVLVYGDTDSTLAGAWAASRAGIPLIHMEAGLRSFDRDMPEEINRLLTDQLSAVLLCPSESAVDQLRKEGVYTDCRPGVLVQASGDLMLDTARWIGGQPEPTSGGNKVLLTMHRPSNVDDLDRLKWWVEAIKNCIEKQNIEVIFPVHPRTEQALKKAFGVNWKVQLMDWGIGIRPPAGYVQMMQWLKEVSTVWTDSGGVQKEAYFMHRPALVLRNSTEWTDLVDVGAAMLSPDPAELMERNAQLMARDFTHVFETNLFGDGRAAEHIATALQTWFQK